MSTWCNPIAEANVGTNGMSGFRNLSFTPTSTAATIDKITNRERSLPKIGYLTPLADLLEEFPIGESTIAKVLVKFFVSETVNGRVS